MANAFGITELTSSQSSKYATVNNMIKYITAFLTGARDIATSVPGSPVENAMYIAGTGSITGAWSAFTVNDLVFYLGSAWYKLSPVEGMSVLVWDENARYTYNGSAWDPDPQWGVASASVSPSSSRSPSVSASASVSPSSSASPSA
jgi:hypothetical protein